MLDHPGAIQVPTGAPKWPKTAEIDDDKKPQLDSKWEEAKSVCAFLQGVWKGRECQIH